MNDYAYNHTQETFGFCPFQNTTILYTTYAHYHRFYHILRIALEAMDVYRHNPQNTQVMGFNGQG